MPLTSILHDMVLQTRILRFEIARTQGQILSDCLYVVHNISPLLHRLLSLSTKVTTSQLDTLSEVLRLTCILYTLTIRFAFGIFTAQAIAQLEKLKAIMIVWEKAGTMRSMWEGTESGWLEVWVYAIGLAASRNILETRDWFQRRFIRALANMGRSEEEFTENMNYFLWIESIHGSIFR
jgi:hypothetical protein